jgi:DNA repair protein RadA
MTDELTDLPGVGKITAEKLKEQGYADFMTIAVATPKELSELAGMTEEGAAKIIHAAMGLANVGEFLTTEELREKRKSLMRLSTGSKQLDSLFKGDGGVGLESGSITELYGEFGTGKTQIALQLAVNATRPVEDGGLGGHVLIIDTENTFRPKRIEEMSKALGLNVEETFAKIHVARAFNSAHQIILLEKKANELAKTIPIKLVIVDSLTAHFRSEFLGRANLGPRQGLLNRHMHELLRFADVNNAVIVVTNQVLTNVGQMFGDPIKPVGGNIVGHTSTYRVYLRKSKAGKKVARMIDSPENPDEEAIYSLGEEGVRDA